MPQFYSGCYIISEISYIIYISKLQMHRSNLHEELNYMKTVIASLNEIIDKPIAQIIENK